MTYHIPEVLVPNLLDSKQVNICMVQEEEWNHASSKDFIVKVLKSIGLEDNSNASIIVTNSNHYFPLHHFDNTVNSIILFGLHPLILGLQGFDQIHHVYQFQGRQILIAMSPDAYQTEIQKRELWTALKLLSI